MSQVNWIDITGWTPQQIDDLRFQGFSFLKEGQYEKALVFFRGLTVLDPVDPYDVQTLGALQLQLGNYGEAIQTFDWALSLAPEHEPTKLNKALALLQTENKPDGLTLLSTLAKSRDPSIASQASALALSYR